MCMYFLHPTDINKFKKRSMHILSSINELSLKLIIWTENDLISTPPITPGWRKYLFECNN